MTNSNDLSAGRRQVARSRGALTGVLLVVAGAWAALVPFIGPYFDFGVGPQPDDAWRWTTARGVYELLPGAVSVLAGLILLLSASRALTLLAAWLGTLAGVWLVVAPVLDIVLKIDDESTSGASSATPLSDGKIVAEALLYFYGIGVIIAVIGAIALGRLSVHSVRDVRAAERRAEVEVPPEPVVPAEPVVPTEPVEARHATHQAPQHEARQETGTTDAPRYEPRLGHDATGGTPGTEQRRADRSEVRDDPYGPPR